MLAASTSWSHTSLPEQLVVTSVDAPVHSRASPVHAAVGAWLSVMTTSQLVPFVWPASSVAVHEKECEPRA